MAGADIKAYRALGALGILAGLLFAGDHGFLRCFNGIVNVSHFFRHSYAPPWSSLPRLRAVCLPRSLPLARRRCFFCLLLRSFLQFCRKIGIIVLISL
jgi:hypothetical protein